MSSVVAPYNLSYSNRVPYITLNEFKNSALSSAVDVNNLVPGGNAAAQNTALQELIVQASTYADTYCLGALGTLCATVTTENGRYRTDRYGRITIAPAYWPILEVQAFEFGPTPALLGAVTLSANNVWIEPRQFQVSGGWGMSSSSGPLGFGSGWWSNQSEMYCQWNYVNGFPNTFLTSQASSGANSIVVTNATGIYPGSVLTLWDAPNDETVTVANTYTAGNTTVPLTANLANTHAAGVNVSNLPATVKQAVIHLTISLIEERGEGGMVLQEEGPGVFTGAGTTSNAHHLDKGEELLEAFVQIWGRS